MKLQLLKRDGTGLITYPPPLDICYGDLVRLRDHARRMGEDQIAEDLAMRVRTFFDPQRPLDLFSETE